MTCEVDVSNTLRQAREQRRAARMAPLFHGSCTTHNSYWLDCDDYTKLRRDHDDKCALCWGTHPWMNIDHDHVLGPKAIRGLLCPRCNAGHMRRVDAGERAIDDRTREYLVNPWYIRRQGRSLAYDPRLSVSIAALGPDDQDELIRLYEDGVSCDYSLRNAKPSFEHVGLTARLMTGDVRPVLRLLWMLDRGRLDTDIAAPIKPFPIWATPQRGSSTTVAR